MTSCLMWHLNSGPHGCVASTLNAKASLQPYHCFLCCSHEMSLNDVTGVFRTFNCIKLIGNKIFSQLGYVFKKKNKSKITWRKIDEKWSFPLTQPGQLSTEFQFSNWNWCYIFKYLCFLVWLTSLVRLNVFLSGDEELWGKHISIIGARNGCSFKDDKMKAWGGGCQEPSTPRWERQW